MIDYRRNLHDTAPGFPFIEISPLALLTDPQGISCSPAIRTTDIGVCRAAG